MKYLGMALLVGWFLMTFTVIYYTIDSLIEIWKDVP